MRVLWKEDLTFGRIHEGGLRRSEREDFKTPRELCGYDLCPGHFSPLWSGYISSKVNFCSLRASNDSRRCYLVVAAKLGLELSTALAE